MTGKYGYSSRDDDPDHQRWAIKVKKRDNYECQLCGARGVWLESHHINSYDWAIEERYDIENGITLCKLCHDSFHNAYDHGKNSTFQFEEFKRTFELLRKIAEKDGR